MELQLQHLCKHYGTKCAVNHVSTTLTPGVYDLLGANGAGKTTLMRMICGVLKSTSGRLCLDRKSIEELGEAYYARLGYMPQDFGFYPDFTARGLDPKERVRFRNLISDFAKDKIVILSTHIETIVALHRTDL